MDLSLIHISGYTISYPVAFDMEDNVYFDFTKEQNNAIAAAFMDQIRSLSYYPILYSYTAFLNNRLDMSRMTHYDVWVADYRGYVGYKGKYGIWQNSSTCLLYTSHL